MTKILSLFGAVFCLALSISYTNACGCVAFANEGDSCWSMATNYNVPNGLQGFLDLNPGLNCNPLALGAEVCVRSGGC